MVNTYDLFTELDYFEMNMGDYDSVLHCIVGYVDNW